MRLSAVLLAGSALAGCTGTGPLAEVPAGSWGGDHVSLTATAEGAVVEFDCAHGTIDQPLLLDSDGQFNLTGVYVLEHGGPIRDGEPEDRHPASYFGQLQSGSRLVFSVRRSDDGTRVGPFTAVLGQRANLFKCL